MKSLLRPFLAGGFATSVALVLSTACADNRASIYVQGVMAPQPPQCNFTNDPTAPQEGRGVLDIAVRASYEATLLVGNQLTPRGEKLQAKAETMRIQLNSAEVTLLDAAGEQLTCDGDDECGAFSVFGTGSISVNRSEEPAFGLFRVQLIPDVVGQSLFNQVRDSGQVTVVAQVRVFGDTLGESAVESGAFTFPIDVCYGCLVVYNQGPCCFVDPANEPGTSCRPGQDDPVACDDRSNCRISGSGEVCDRQTPDTVCPAPVSP